MIRAAVSGVPWRVRGQVRLIPGVASAQRWLTSKALDGTEFEHRVDAGPAKGVRFWIRMPEDKGIWTGTYEQSFAERVATAIRPGCVAYDVGGWHGFFAGVMAARSAGKVIVFEPLPANIDRIERLMALNPLLPIELQRLALAESVGAVELVVMPQTSMAKLAEIEFQPAEAPDGRIIVPAETIDSLVSSGAIPAPHVMKLDVEGAEVLVLSGAKNVLSKHRPIVFAEVHSSKLLRQVNELLGNHGYTVAQIDEDQAAAARKDVFHVHAAVA